MLPGPNCSGEKVFLERRDFHACTQIHPLIQEIKKCYFNSRKINNTIVHSVNVIHLLIRLL